MFMNSTSGGVYVHIKTNMNVPDILQYALSKLKELKSKEKRFDFLNLKVLSNGTEGGR